LIWLDLRTNRKDGADAIARSEHLPALAQLDSALGGRFTLY
jgi:hypothetical protein